MLKRMRKSAAWRVELTLQLFCLILGVGVVVGGGMEAVAMEWQQVSGGDGGIGGEGVSRYWTTSRDCYPGGNGGNGTANISGVGLNANDHENFTSLGGSGGKRLAWPRGDINDPSYIETPAYKLMFNIFYYGLNAGERAEDAFSEHYDKWASGGNGNRSGFISVQDKATLTKEMGWNCLPGGGGGGGGAAGFVSQSTVTLPENYGLLIYGGNGGGAGESGLLGDQFFFGGGFGGNGGQAYLSVSSLFFKQQIKITGGNGGADTMGFRDDYDGDYYPPARGGRGGDAIFEANNLYFNGTAADGGVYIASGGTGQYFQNKSSLFVDPSINYGGDVKFNIGRLQTPILDITKKNGLVKAGVIALDMTAMDMNVGITDNFGNDDYVTLGNMYLAGGHGFNLNFKGATNPIMKNVTLAGNLQVTGKGNYFNSPLEYYNDKTGNTAYFQVQADVKPGDVMLTAFDAPIVVSKLTKILMTVDSLETLTNLANFKPSEQIVLIHNNEGEVEESAVTTSVGATDLVFKIINQQTADGFQQVVANLLDVDTGKAAINNLSNVSRLAIVDNGQYAIVNVAELLKAIENPEIGTFLNTISNDDVFHPECTVSMRSVYGMAGVKRAIPTGWGSFQFGAFFDAARGNYSSEESYKGFELRGDGKADTIGGGIFLGALWKNGFGLDASFRFGRVRSDLSTNSGSVGYDSSTHYLGGHLTVSHTFDLNAKSSIRPYARFLWAFEDEDDVVTRAGENLHFDEVKSARLQLGARYSYNFSRSLTAYADAALECQADGRIGSLLNGIPVNRINMSGRFANLKLGGIWQQCPDTGKGWDARIEGGISTDLNNRTSYSGAVMVGYGF